MDGVIETLKRWSSGGSSDVGEDNNNSVTEKGIHADHAFSTALDNSQTRNSSGSISPLPDMSQLAIAHNSSVTSSDFGCKVVMQGGWLFLVILRGDSWAGHAVESKGEASSGVRCVIRKTDKKGPYSAPYTAYFLHTQTAFAIKGASRRFSEFRELDSKIRNKYASLPPLPEASYFNKLDPIVVETRKKSLQNYIDCLLEIPGAALDVDVQNFLELKESDVKASDSSRGNGNSFSNSAEAVKEILSGNSVVEIQEKWLREAEEAQKAGRSKDSVRLFNNCAVVCAESERSSEAIRLWNLASQLAARSQLQMENVVVLCNQGSLHCLMDCVSIARDAFSQALKCSSSTHVQCEILRCLSLAAAASGDTVEAVNYAEKGLSHAKDAGDDARIAEACVTLGALRASSEVRLAVDSLEEALVLRRKLRDPVGMAEALHRMGVTFADIGYDNRAADYVEQALVLAEDACDIRGQALCLSSLGSVSKLQRDYHVAVEHYERCLACHARLNNLDGQASSLEALGSLYYALGDHRAAVSKYDLALGFREKLEDLAGQAECHKHIGASIVRLGDPSAAVKHFRKCLELATRSGDDAAAVDALVSLGLAHFRAGHNSEAVRVLERSLAAFEARSDLLGCSVCLDHLANVHHRLGDSATAAALLEKSLSVKRRRGDEKGAATTLLRIGEERLGLARAREALESLTQALAAFERLDDDNGVATCYERLGDAYIRMGLPSDAVVMYRKALPIRVESWDKPAEGRCLDALGLAHYSLGQLKDASSCYQSATSIWSAEEDKQALMESLEALGGVLFQLGDHQRAVQVYTKHLQLVRETADGHADAEVLVRLGLSHSAIGHNDKALRALSGALAAFSAANDMNGKALCLQHIGSVRGRMGNVVVGVAALEQSLRLRKEQDDVSGQADCLLELGLLHTSNGDPSQGLNFLEEARATLSRANDRASMSAILLHIGQALRAVGRHEEAVARLQQALVVGESAEDSGAFSFYGGWKSKAACLHELGLAQRACGTLKCLETFEREAAERAKQGDAENESAALVASVDAREELCADDASLLHRSETAMFRALKLAKDSGNPLAEAAVLLRLGQTSLRSGDVSSAASNFRRCQSLLQGLENGQDELLSALCGLGMVFLMPGGDAMVGHSEALEACQRAFNTMWDACESGQKSLSAMCVDTCTLLGQVLMLDNRAEGVLLREEKEYCNPQLALDYLQRIQLAPCWKDVPERSRIKAMFCTADSLTRMKQFDQAYSMIKSAYAVMESANLGSNAELASTARLSQARCEFEQGNPDRAIQILNAFRATMQTVRSLLGEAYACCALCEVYLFIGKLESAVLSCESGISACEQMSIFPSGLLKRLYILQQAAHIRRGDAFRAAAAMEQLKQFSALSSSASSAGLQNRILAAEESGNNLELARLRHASASAQKLQNPNGALFELNTSISIFRKLLQESTVSQGIMSQNQVQCISGLALSLSHQSLIRRQSNQEGFLDDCKAARSILKMFPGHGDDMKEFVEHYQSKPEMAQSVEAALVILFVESDDQGFDVLESLLSLAQSAKCQSAEEMIASNLAMAYVRAGEMEKALPALKLVAGGHIGIPDTSCSEQIGSTLLEIERHQAAKRLVQQQLQVVSNAASEGNSEAEAQALLQLAASQLSLAQLHQAEENAHKAQSMFEGFPEGRSYMISAGILRGQALEAQGLYQRAFEHLSNLVFEMTKSLDRAAFAGRMQQSQLASLTQASCALIRCSSQIGKHDFAIEAGRKSLAFSVEAGDIRTQVETLTCLSSCLRKCGLLIPAKDHISRALTMTGGVHIELNSAVIEAQIELARVLSCVNSATATRAAIDKAIALVKMSDIKKREAEVLLAASQIYLEIGDSSLALENAEQAQRAALISGDPQCEISASISQARANLCAGRPFAALDAVAGALSLSKAIGDVASRALCLMVQGLAHCAVARDSKSEVELLEAQQFAEQTGSVSILCQVGLARAKLYSCKRNSNDLVSALQSVLKISSAPAGHKGLFKVLGVETVADISNYVDAQSQLLLNQTGPTILGKAEKFVHFVSQCSAHDLLIQAILVYARLCPDGVEAQRQASKALAMCDESLMPKRTAQSHVGVGKASVEVGDVKLAESSFRDALTLFHRCNDCYSEAECHRLLCDLTPGSSSSLQHLRSAISLYDQSSSRREEAQVMLQLGMSFAQNGDYNQASVYVKKASSSFEALKDSEMQQVALRCMCEVYSVRGVWDQVKDSAGKLKEVAAVRGERSVESFAMLKLGECAIEDGRLDAALSFFRASLSLREMLSDILGKAECHERLSRLALRMGDSNASKSHLAKLKQIRKQLGKDAVDHALQVQHSDWIKAVKQNLWDRILGR